MRLLLSLTFFLALAAPAAADSIVYTKDTNVWVARPDGSEARQVTQDGGYQSPSQADDGTIVAARGDKLYKLDRQGRQLAVFGSVLTGKPGSIGAVGPFDARISPDGTTVAYAQDEHVWLVRQPRQAVDDPDVLEIPAGKLDEAGESPLDTAKRELAEEIGKGAERWESLRPFWTSVGILDEEVHLYLATGLRDEHAETDEDERIEVVRWPLDRLEELLDTVKDSKTRIGLLELHRRRANG